ncbi:tetratricopeptide repeat protein [Desulfovibrio sp. JC010]|nr:tetratricopeptide repeat protein [Desulfovibrio sp. JC010]
MVVPGFPWFWEQTLTIKLTLFCVVFAGYPVVVHIVSFFKKKPERMDSQSLAEKLYDDLKVAQQAVQSKDQDIKALKDVIDGLREPQETPEEDSHAARAEAELAKGNFELAEAFYLKQAQKDEESANESALKAAEAYRNAGFLVFMNNPKKAFQAYQKSVELDPNSAEGWNRLGLLQSLFGKFEDAKIACMRILQLKKNDKKWKAVAYGNLGNIHSAQGNLKSAEKFYNKVLLIAKGLGCKDTMAPAYGSLGLIRKIQGDLEGAEEFYNKALEIGKELDCKERIAIQYGNLGSIRHSQGDLNGAEYFYNKSLEIGIELDSKERIAIQYGNLGLIRMSHGDYDGAEKLYNKALEIDKEIGRKEGIAANYSNLGLICIDRGDIAGAEEFYYKALELDKELGRKEGLAVRYGNLGSIRQIQGDLEGAEEFWKKSLTLYKQIGAAPMIEKVQGWLDELEENKEN